MLAIGVDDFPESHVIMSFLDEHLTFKPLKREEFYDGSWLARVDELIQKPRKLKSRVNGADLVATFLHDLLQKYLRKIC